MRQVTAFRMKAPRTRKAPDFLNEMLAGAAVVIEPVSADSLRKTGIFANMAGDFRRFLPRLRRTRSLETKTIAQKAGISGLFSRLFGSPGERRKGLAGDAVLIAPVSSQIPC